MEITIEKPHELLKEAPHLVFQIHVTGRILNNFLPSPDLDTLVFLLTSLPTEQSLQKLLLEIFYGMKDALLTNYISS